MKKIIRLTEQDLISLVKKVLNEQASPQADVWACINKYNEEHNFSTLQNGTKPDRKWEEGNPVDNKKTYFVYLSNGQIFWNYESDNKQINRGTWKCQTSNSYVVTWSDGSTENYTQACTTYVQNDATVEDLISRKKVVKKCDKGDIVTKIQKRLKTYYQTELGGSFDPKFGDKTEQAVKKFQKKKGLEDDGIVGHRTAKYLFPNPTNTIPDLRYPGGLKPELEAQAKENGELQQTEQDLFWKDAQTKKKYMGNPANLQK